MGPSDIFTPFFTKTPIQTLVLNTNAYAKENSAGEPGRRWKELAESELQVYMGIVLMSPTANSVTCVSLGISVT